MKKWSIRIFLLLLCAALLCGAAFASNEITLDVTFYPIEYDGYVVDKLFGVPAIYNKTGPILYCSEYVERLYREAYGIPVYVSDGPHVSGNSSYWFEVTHEPQTGDVLYASAEARQVGCSHYAVVKSVDKTNGTMTLIEQNWGWNEGAAFERVIPYDGACYTIYTLWSKDGRMTLHDGALQAASQQPQMQQPQSGRSITVSDWAKEYVNLADAYGITGDLTGDFRRPATRGEIAALAVNTLALHGVCAWAQDPVDAACELGIMSLYSTGSFESGWTVTREMAATVFSRVYARIGVLPAENLSVLNRYSDCKKISFWAEAPVAAMTQLGFMNGTGSGFSPEKDMTVEQVITVMVRMIQTKK